LEIATKENLYEAMFLIDSSLAARDWESVNKTITNILKRAKAEIISIRKWDERRLAYDINGQNRGTYLLCYFKVDGQKITAIERDAQLSEKVMRVLILNAEHLTETDIEKDTPATHTEKKAKRFAEKVAEAKKKITKKLKPTDKDKQPEPKPAAQAKPEQPQDTEQKPATPEPTEVADKPLESEEKTVETAPEGTSQTREPQPPESNKTIPADEEQSDKTDET
jgi:small subunit ribosomal protein S6